MIWPSESIPSCIVARSDPLVLTKAKEAEKARLLEEKRRDAEAKRQAKTRVLMSSLFDKVCLSALLQFLGYPSSGVYVEP